MAGEALELEARLKDYLSGELGNITKSLSQLQDKYDEVRKRNVKNASAMEQATKDLKKSWDVGKIALGSFIGSLGAMEVFNRVTRFIYNARQEAKEYNAQQIQLRASLGYVSIALREQADELQRKLTIDDNVIGSLQQLISLYVKDEDKIKQLTIASLNFSAATGIDAHNAAMILSRAIEGNTAMLSRYGIRIKDVTGDLNKVDVVINAVNRRFGGQAEALAKSKDFWDKAGVAIKEATKEIGLLFSTENSPARQEAHIKFMERMKAEWEQRRKMHAAGWWLMDEWDTRQAASFDKQYQSDTMVNERRRANFNRTMDEHFAGHKKENDLTEKLQNELWAKTEEGKLRLLQNERKVILSNTEYTEQQRKLIIQRIDIEIAEHRKKLRNEEREKDKSRYDFYLMVETSKQNVADAHAALEAKRYAEGEENTRKLMDADYALQRTRAEADDNKYIREQRLLDLQQQQERESKSGLELDLIVKKQLIEKDTLIKRQGVEQKKEEKRSAQNRIENVQYQTDYILGSLKTVAQATKAGSAIQKGLDVTQAIANTAIGVTKNLAAGMPWLIPFTLATGMAQVAIISRQKYATGGIVGGGSPAAGDTVPAMLTPGEMVLNSGQQANLFSLLQRPNVTSNSAVHLNINVAQGGTYDMSAARYTVDQLVPVLGDALVRAKSEGRLRNYEAAR